MVASNVTTAWRRGVPGGARRLAMTGLCGVSIVAVLTTGVAFAPALAQAAGSQEGGSAAAAQPASGTKASEKAASSSHGDASAASSSRDGISSSRVDGASASATGAEPSAGGATAKDFKDMTYEDIPADALISARDLRKAIKDGGIEDKTLTVVDIRSHRDYTSQMIDGSINVPAGRQIDIRMNEIPRDQQVVLVSLYQSDRLAETWYTLVDNGYDPALVKVLDGGIRAWTGAGYPTTGDRFLGC